LKLQGHYQFRDLEDCGWDITRSVRHYVKQNKPMDIVPKQSAYEIRKAKVMEVFDDFMKIYAQPSSKTANRSLFCFLIFHSYCVLPWFACSLRGICS
jgi:hypothetical protein